MSDDTIPIIAHVPSDASALALRPSSDTAAIVVPATTGVPMHTPMPHRQARKRNVSFRRPAPRRRQGYRNAGPISAKPPTAKPSQAPPPATRMELVTQLAE